MSTSTRSGPWRDRLGRVLLRTAYLFLGAALFMGFALLDLGIVVLSWQARPGVLTALGLALLVVVPPALVALIPGVRDLEVVACRSLLAPRKELFAPAPRTAATMRRTVAFVLAHLVAGGAAGAVAVIGVPTVLTLARDALTGPGRGSVGSWAVRPAGAYGAVVCAAAVVALALGVAVVWALGVAMERLAPVLLGPTDHDRLAVAEQRLRREVGHQRLARDLHDGIGHALSVISLHATAGRQVIDRSPQRAAEALRTVEEVAATAIGDLDHMLGVLREDDDQPTSRTPARALGDVPELLAGHRAAGLPIDAQLADAGRVPMLVSREGFRIVQEALTNARRHGAGGPVLVRTDVPGHALVVEVVNQLPPLPAARSGGGHGLVGLRERAELFGGRVDAGEQAGQWRLRVELPFGHRDG